MKIFIYLLIVLAIVVIGYNITLLNFDDLFSGDSGIALIGILCAACVIVLLAILLTSRSISKRFKQ